MCKSRLYERELTLIPELTRVNSRIKVNSHSYNQPLMLISEKWKKKTTQEEKMGRQKIVYCGRQ